MVVFAAKLKPPTDFSYFVDEQQRRRPWRQRAESSFVVL